jgi:hypothetical protein
MSAPDETRTTYLGRFDEFEAQVVLELLEEAGIFAYSKHDQTENDHFMYSSLMESERGVILVDATKVEEARKVISEQLPEHLESIHQSMEALERGEQQQD